MLLGTIMERYLPGHASHGFVQFGEKKCAFADCLRSLGFKGAARAYANFVHDVFGPPSWGADGALDGMKSRVPRANNVYVPLCFVVSPATPLYMNALPAAARSNEAGPPTSPLAPARGGRCAASYRSLVDDQLSLLKRARRIGGGLTLVPACDVDSSVGAPPGSALRYGASALRLTQLAHMFQRPNEYHALDQPGPAVGQRPDKEGCDSFALFFAFVEAARVIAKVADEDDASLEAGPVSFLGDWVDRAIGDAGDGRPDPCLASALECACYMVGRAPGPFTAIEKHGKGDAIEGGAQVRSVRAVRAVPILRAAATVLGVEARRASADAPSPDLKKALDIASGAAKSDACSRFPYTAVLLRRWVRSDAKAVSTPAGRRALARMTALIQYASPVVPERTGPSVPPGGAAETGADSDVTETDS